MDLAKDPKMTAVCPGSLARSTKGAWVWRSVKKIDLAGFQALRAGTTIEAHE
jgi:hypothetical protein